MTMTRTQIAHNESHRHIPSLFCNAANKSDCTAAVQRTKAALELGARIFAEQYKNAAGLCLSVGLGPPQVS
ncbi:unnamed protein product [Didymodactylos carnosus]|uniref:Uncharacterized protein n=1 Tax=Didymodactylos carnosus TaxID=1234261 RepID=A0A813T0R2_9BILA|nr:unnamed protein product [Didymodactylos carnosus]CAF3588877.1 unnamed protein product [Didymodactylos carnosus]